jgi:hypothetical protein
MEVRYSDPGGKNYCSFARHHTNLKNPHTNRFCIVTPIVSSKYRHLYRFCYVKIFSIYHNRNLLLLDYPGRVRSQITSVVCQIQRFDFDYILAVSRKLIIWTHPPLRLKPIYIPWCVVHSCTKSWRSDIYSDTSPSSVLFEGGGVMSQNVWMRVTRMK